MIGATTSLGIWVSGQVGGHAFRTPVGRSHGYTTVLGHSGRGHRKNVDAPEVAVSSPPFVVLLAGREATRCASRYTDTADWLREDARDRT